MSNKKFSNLLMALVAMSCFSPCFSFAQGNQPKAFSSKIKTPNTSKELMNDSNPATKTEKFDVEEVEEREASTTFTNPATSSQRKLRQHGIGLGLGQTFLLGNYAKYGTDKITADLLYTYAASYSFDLLVDLHMSESKDQSEKMKVMGLATSIKGRVVEYDNFSPYVLGGLGFYAPGARRNINGRYKNTDQKVTFGFNFGGGLDLRLNDEFVVGVMGQMHCPFVTKQDNQPDLRGYYAKLMITGMYLFQ
jgi:opacity protein-like surface antigen